MPDTEDAIVRVGQLAIAEEAARRERAQARTHLAKLRREWHAEYESYFNLEEHAREEGTPAMLAAIQRREDANRRLRLAHSRTRAAIRKVTAAASISKEESRG